MKLPTLSVIAESLVLLVALAGLGGGCSTNQTVSAPTQTLDLQATNRELSDAQLHTVIFAASKVEGSRGLGGKYTPTWDPSTDVVKEGVARLPDFLEAFQKNRKPGTAYATVLTGVIDRLPTTVCQAVGITWKGRRAIMFNCLPVDDHSSKGWREVFIKRHDVGPCWWNVIYLSEDQTFAELRIDLGY